MIMTEEALAAEAKIHALIHAQMKVFLLPGALDLMTARDDWSDVEAEYESVVTPELASKFEITRNGRTNEQDGFLVTKNGEVGQWVEMEYASVHRDEPDQVAESWGDETPPSTTDLIAKAGWAATMLKTAWPEADFHVVEGSQAWGGRVSMGAFLSEGISNRAEIIDDFYKTSLPKLGNDVIKQLYGPSYDTVNDYFEALTPPAAALKM
jgi:hypothetical protein